MNEAEAVLEFREASAAVRRAFGARDDARVDQILADTRMASATVNLSDAQARLHAADMALQSARAEPPAPADIDVTRMAQFGGGMGGVIGADGAPINNAEHNAYSIEL